MTYVLFSRIRTFKTGAYVFVNCIYRCMFWFIPLIECIVLKLYANNRLSLWRSSRALVECVRGSNKQIS